MEASIDLEIVEECAACEVGQYTGATRTTSCVACPAGYKAPYEGQSQCSKCSMGYFSGLGDRICTRCPRNYATSVEGSANCEFRGFATSISHPMGERIDGGSSIAISADGLTLAVGEVVSAASCVVTRRNSASAPQQWGQRICLASACPCVQIFFAPVVARVGWATLAVRWTAGSDAAHT